MLTRPCHRQVGSKDNIRYDTRQARDTALSFTQHKPPREPAPEIREDDLDHVARESKKWVTCEKFSFSQHAHMNYFLCVQGELPRGVLSRLQIRVSDPAILHREPMTAYDR